MKAGLRAATLVAALFAIGGGVGAQAPSSPSPSSFASGGLPTRAPPGTALLAAGPERVLGLPFFAPNAIPALRGRYLFGASAVELWFTRDSLVFPSTWVDSPAWSRATGARAFATTAGDGRLELALRFPSWWLILALPGDDAEARRFVVAFVERFGFFLANAKSDDDVSFPATVSY